MERKVPCVQAFILYRDSGLGIFIMYVEPLCLYCSQRLGARPSHRASFQSLLIDSLAHWASFLSSPFPSLHQLLQLLDSHLTTLTNLKPQCFPQQALIRFKGNPTFVPQSLYPLQGVAREWASPSQWETWESSVSKRFTACSQRTMTSLGTNLSGWGWHTLTWQNITLFGPPVATWAYTEKHQGTGRWPTGHQPASANLPGSEDAVPENMTHAGTMKIKWATGMRHVMCLSKGMKKCMVKPVN